MSNAKEKEKISIYYNSYSESWYFNGEAEGTYKICDCGTIIDHLYVYIIDKLKKAKLLDENYPILCCRCFNRGIKNAS